MSQAIVSGVLGFFIADLDAVSAMARAEMPLAVYRVCMCVRVFVYWANLV